MINRNFSIVDIQQNKRGAVDLGWINPQALRDSFDQRRLAAAQIAAKADNISWLQMPGQFPPKIHSLFCAF